MGMINDHEDPGESFNDPGGRLFNDHYDQGLTGRVFQLRVGYGSGIGKNILGRFGYGSGTGICII